MKKRTAENKTNRKIYKTARGRTHPNPPERTHVWVVQFHSFVLFSMGGPETTKARCEALKRLSLVKCFQRFNQSGVQLFTLELPPMGLTYAPMRTVSGPICFGPFGPVWRACSGQRWLKPIFILVSADFCAKVSVMYFGFGSRFYFWKGVEKKRKCLSPPKSHLLKINSQDVFFETQKHYEIGFWDSLGNFCFRQDTALQRKGY